MPMRKFSLSRKSSSSDVRGARARPPSAWTPGSGAGSPSPSPSPSPAPASAPAASTPEKRKPSIACVHTCPSSPQRQEQAPPLGHLRVAEEPRARARRRGGLAACVIALRARDGDHCRQPKPEREPKSQPQPRRCERVGGYGRRRGRRRCAQRERDTHAPPVPVDRPQHEHARDTHGIPSARDARAPAPRRAHCVRVLNTRRVRRVDAHAHPKPLLPVGPRRLRQRRRPGLRDGVGGSV
ncbi:hypothetical protein CC85DRAFT_29213 [Cutaneotrichosporon oleaginosum]|uniref:Uncharacterized protein n=1 Tax=Cutaneotrichosporon oleaginosum TaxID=879819 RepID=A0A0J1AT13_9TREE|nr:uncharacterized protein CC85DRAFT_29213 [Cutaneotrichosporon oleaginosum]KLT38459.1 hypothetical protein CC85DRAFT_29213 [Cutaneotrichosporon oleaginosum]TXT05431.1 hypothetical protein COLE_06751 [Cutaneotrichosporon oleaginosum]